MIHAQIAAFADTFERQSRKLFASYPALVLDGTWPSVGIVDLLLFSLRGKNELNDDDEALLQGGASYIGRFLYEVWSTFGDGSKCELTLRGTSEIVLILRGGAFLGPEDSVTLSLSNTLGAVLRELPNPLPVFESYRFPITPFDNLLSLVAAGAASVITPYAEGPLATKRIYELAPYVMSAQRVLAESAAKHYKSLHAGEPLGQTPDLYMSGLIYPPPGYDERFGFCRAAVGLVEFFGDRDLSAAEIEKCAYNLAQSPDAITASTAFAVLAALVEQTPSASLIALSENKRLQLQRLRPAVAAARKALGLPHDWITLLDEGKEAEALALIRCEARLGLLPLLQADPTALVDPQLRGLCHAIAWNDVAAGLENAESILQATNFSSASALQLIFFDIASGNLESAELGIAAIKQREHATPEVLARSLRLGAQCRMLQGDWSGARAQLQNALRYGTFDASTRCAVLNELAFAYILNGDGDSALPHLDEALEIEPYHITHRLNRIAALQLSNETDAIMKEAQAVSHYAPTDPRVFDLIRSISIPTAAPLQH